MSFTMRRPILCSVLASVTCALAPELAAAPSTRPNFVLIFADDLGWKDVGYAGTDFYETPNIDRLAREGMTFTAGYASAGNCAPSRACLLSGQYTPRHAVYAVGSTNRGPRRLMRMVPVRNETDLAPATVTMAEALRAAGYATGHFGKWHLGAKARGTDPASQGFDTCLLPGTQGGSEDPKHIYAITRAACEFITRNRDRPFFAYVSHHAIHTRLESRRATLARFEAKAPGTQHSNARYAACTYDLDDGVGQLLGTLRDLGLRERTLVIFTSDNGATPRSSQEPLRGAKGSYYEGGVRVPFVASWPGTIAPGSTCDVPVINLDLYPTFCAAAGAPVPAGTALDGESLVPLLAGKGRLTRRAIYWHFPGYLDRPVPRGRDPVFRTRPVTVMRTPEWKLHLYHEEWQLDGGRERIDTNNAVELYNLARDIGERRNLALAERERRDELLRDLTAWWQAVRAPLPTERNPAYDPDSAPADAKRAKRRKARKSGGRT